MKKVAYIFGLAFILNFIWENLHAFLYANYQGGAITEMILLRASFVDAIFITVVGTAFIKLKFFKERTWLVLLIGIIAAAGQEMYALASGRWAYNSLMPIIPILNVGLTPTIQLGLLAYIKL
jgi:1,4-dihydroxy-2-naphthoate octaprenyltransferase